MTISPHDLAPGEDASQLGIISRPFSPQLRAGPTSAIDKIKEAYYAYTAAAVAWEVVGVDVSVWQGRMNWEVTKPLVNFAVIRAGHGGSADTQLDNNRTGCDKFGVPFGLYWYFVPLVGWLAQARTYAAIYNDNPGKLDPVIDVEESGSLSRSELTSQVKKFLDEFELRTKRKCMIYTSASFWNTYLNNPTWAKLYKLWVANYTSASKPYMPVGWPKWTKWQWSNKGNGVAFGAQSKFIDLNRYWGTFADFEQEYNIEHEHDVYVPIVIKMKACETSQPYLNIRKEPSTLSNTVGKLLPGMEFTVKDFGGPSCWAQITGGEFEGNWVCVELNGVQYSELVKEKVTPGTSEETIMLRSFAHAKPGGRA